MSEATKTESEVAKAPQPSETPRKSNVPKGRIGTITKNLFASIEAGKCRQVKMLLDTTGCSVHVRNEKGWTTLLTALRVRDEEKRKKMLKILLERDAEPLALDGEGSRDALMWAVAWGLKEEAWMLFTDVVGELDLNRRDKDGLTMLHLATINEHIEIVTLLCKLYRKYGLNVDVTDNMGLTPFLHAKKLGYHDICEILISWGKSSKHQFDLKTFRMGDDWNKFGKEEKKKEERERRKENVNKLLIRGRVGRVPGFIRSMYEPRFITHSPEHFFRTSAHGIPSQASKRSMRSLKSARSVDSIVALLDTTSQSHTKVLQRPEEFKSSEFDCNKEDQYPSIARRLYAMMEVQAEQETTSFREAAKPPLPPNSNKLDPINATVSTLAIIFDDNKRKTVKRKTTVISEGNPRPTKLSEERARRAGRLPHLKEGRTIVREVEGIHGDRRNPYVSISRH